MADERMTDLLRVVDRPVEPDPVFLDRLYDDLSAELGFRSRAARSPGRPRRSLRSWLLLAAMLALILAGSAVLAGAAVRLLEERQRSDLLDAIHREGVLRVLVRDGFPQARSPEGAIGGFDIDVAVELAERLGVASDIHPLGTAERSMAFEWQVALDPGVPDGEEAAYRASGPIYYWPIHLIVPVGSAVDSISELDGAAICVVRGSSGEAWLASTYDGSRTTPVLRPPEAAAVTLPDDEACLEALAAGSVAAAVTADLGPAELAVRGTIRALADPVLSEERSALVDPGMGDVDALLEALDAAIEAARADGTLTDLSRRRFGGRDLSVPPSMNPQED